MEINKEQIVLDLRDVATVEVISVGNHFAMFLKGDSDSHLDHMKAYSCINQVLQKNGVLDVYPNVQVMKNESDYFIVTLNK